MSRFQEEVLAWLQDNTEMGGDRNFLLLLVNARFDWLRLVFRNAEDELIAGQLEHLLKDNRRLVRADEEWMQLTGGKGLDGIRLERKPRLYDPKGILAPMTVEKYGSYRVIPIASTKGPPVKHTEDVKMVLTRIVDLLEKVGAAEVLEQITPKFFHAVRRDVYLPPRATAEGIELDAYMEMVRKREKTPAGKRARKLLYEHLTEHQREQYERERFFHVSVHGPLRDWESLPPNVRKFFAKPENPHILRFRRYRIEKGYTNGNVLLAGENHQAFARFCLHPKEPFPSEDALLAQKLLIESDEHKFLQEANVSDPRGIMTGRLYPASEFLPLMRGELSRVP